jgi:NAD/NADP transhydrogenase beta subunit
VFGGPVTPCAARKALWVGGMAVWKSDRAKAVLVVRNKIGKASGFAGLRVFFRFEGFVGKPENLWHI